jgi:RimJ/RimL family protein N-acetyltransferase
MSGEMAADRPTARLMDARAALRWLAGALQYGLIRIRSRLLLQARIGQQLVPVLPSIPVRYVSGAVDDLQRLAAMDARYDTASFQRDARQAIARGDWLVLGEHAGEVIFVGWVLFGAIKTGRGRIRRISPHWAYTYSTFTTVAYRGKRVASGFYAFVGLALESRGYTRLVCWVSDRNVPSLKAHARAGFTVVDRLYELRLIRWRTYWASRGIRRFFRSATP